MITGKILHYVLIFLLIAFWGCKSTNTIESEKATKKPASNIEENEKSSTSFSSLKLDSISPQMVAEGESLPEINFGINGVSEINNEVIYYNCMYDQNIDGEVNNSFPCNSLSGLNFDGVFGLLNWTPNYYQAGGYEFKVIGCNMHGCASTTFVIFVANTPAQPFIQDISDQIAYAGGLFTLDVNGDNDIDADGNALTYSCTFGEDQSCSDLADLNFNTSTGFISWTPINSQAGNYIFTITATNNAGSFAKSFNLELRTTSGGGGDSATLSLDPIANYEINEGSFLPTINAGMNGQDLDSAGNQIFYNCYYDTTVNGSVANTLDCNNLNNMTFDPSQGILNFSPNYFQSGVYEIKIAGCNGEICSNRIFSITVNNINRPPSIDSIANQAIPLGSTFSLNINDGGDDFDIDLQPLTYSCYVDQVQDGNVDVIEDNLCSSQLNEFSFNTSTGIINWVTSNLGQYEFKIVASDGELSDSVIFNLNIVTMPTNQLASIQGSEAVLYIKTIGDTHIVKVTNSGLKIFNLNNNETPIFQSANMTSIWDIKQFNINGYDILFISSNGTAYYINITDINNPVQVTSTGGSDIGGIGKIEVFNQDNQNYLAAGSQDYANFQLYTINLSVMAGGILHIDMFTIPGNLNFFYPHESPDGVFQYPVTSLKYNSSNKRIYLFSNWGWEFFYVDITNINEPIYSNPQESYSCFSMLIFASNIYCHSNQLHVYNQDQIFLGNFISGSPHYHDGKYGLISPDQETIYIARNAGSFDYFSAIDLEGGAKGYFNYPSGNLLGFDINNNSVYFSTNSGYYVVDRTDHETILESQSVKNYTHVTTYQNYLYVINSTSNKLEIFDITTPSNPVIVNEHSFDNYGMVNNIKIINNYLFIIMESAIANYDLINPTAPNLTNVLWQQFGNMQDIQYVNDKYLILESHGVGVRDSEFNEIGGFSNWSYYLKMITKENLVILVSSEMTFEIFQEGAAGGYSAISIESFHSHYNWGVISAETMDNDIILIVESPVGRTVEIHDITDPLNISKKYGIIDSNGDGEIDEGYYTTNHSKLKYINGFLFSYGGGSNTKILNNNGSQGVSEAATLSGATSNLHYTENGLLIRALGGAGFVISN
jgi:hypothetical protein